MIALYIIGGLLLLILILLMLRIRITVSYKKSPDDAGEGSVIAGLGPVRIKLYPKKEKQLKLSDFSAKKYREMRAADVQKKPAPKRSEQKSEKMKNELLPGGFGETMELVLELVEKFTGHLRCEVYRLRLNVGTKSAATTALTYSAATSAVAFILETLEYKTDLRLRSPEDVKVTADFESGELYGDVSIRFSIRIVNILRAGSGFIKNYFRTLIRLDKQN